jgi:uncharacterized protein
MTTARDVFDYFREHMLAGSLAEMCAPDVVIETPFAAGGPSRIEGRDNFLAVTKTSRETLPVRVEEMRDVVVYDTTDPNRIIVEYELVGTVLTTGKRESALFIAVMEVRDGLMTLWREYQNTLAMARALGQVPELDTDFASPAQPV